VDDYRLKQPPSLDKSSGSEVVPAREADAPPLVVGPTTRLLDPHRPTWLLVLALAWPTLLQQLLVFAVNMFDGLMAGRFQDVTGAEQIASQAAQTTANYLAWFLSTSAMLVSVGATAVVARLLGAGDRRTAVHAANQAIVLAVALGAGGAVFGWLGLSSILGALHLSGEEAELAAAFLRPMFGLLAFQMVELVGLACLVGAGDTRTGMFVLGGVALVNMPLTWLFFHGMGPIPALGFAGIGTGTAVAHTLGGLAVLAVLAHGRAGLRLHPRLIAPNPELMWRLLRISVPAGMDSLSLTLGQLWFLGMVNQALGDVDQAAHGIAIRWEALSYLTGQAFGTAAMALVGQNLGARRPEQAGRSGWTAYALGGSWMACMGAVFYMLAPEMFGLFCPKPEQAPIITAGVPVLRLVALAQPALAATNIFAASLRGAGDTRVPVLITWIGFFGCRIPLAYLLMQSEFHLGLVGAWTAMFIDLYVRGLLILGRFASGRWKRLRV